MNRVPIHLQSMLRNRRGSGELPTTSSKFEDGSGKSIKMDSPLVKAIRSADGFVKATYIWFFLSIFFIWGGWTWIRRNSASMVLDCNADGCTLSINAPYSYIPKNSNDGLPMRKGNKYKRKTKIEIKREQIVRADNIKWDPENEEIVENYGINSPTYASQQQQKDEEEDWETNGDEGDERRPNRPNKPWNQHKRNKRKNKKKYKKYNKQNNYSRNGGPDEDGNYDTYILVLRDPLPPTFDGDEDEDIDPNESPSKRMQRQMAAQHNSMAHDPNSLVSLLAPYIITEDGDRELSTSTEYIIHPRDFNIGQTRRLARTTVSKINAYIKGRRSTCIVRESRPVAWQGLVLLILGIFSFVLCLLLGMFWEDHDPTKHGSYKQRMKEIRKRQEAQKLRQQRRIRKPAVRRNVEGTRSVGGRVGRSVSSGTAMSASSASSNVRMRPNASTYRG